MKVCLFSYLIVFNDKIRRENFYLPKISAEDFAWYI